MGVSDGRYPTDRIQLAIRRALRGAEPLGIADLMFWIDAQERIAATADELNEALSASINAGLVHELPDRRFAAGPSAAPSAVFTPLTEVEVNEAYREYAEIFNESDSSALPPEAPTSLKVDCYYALPDGRFPDDADEDALEPIVDAMLAELQAKGIVGAVLGLQLGPGAIDFVISAAESVNAEEILTLVRPVFMKLAPSGSNCAVGHWGAAAPNSRII
jgi:hypothetical protein